MKTSRIIFISFFSFIGILLLAFMFLGITFKDKRTLRERRLKTPGNTVVVDKPFKHIFVKSESALSKDEKQKDTNVKKNGKGYFLHVDCSKKSVKANLSIAGETSLQKSENRKLPKFFYGEWYQKGGSREYNGMLIRPDFMEHSYQACIYDKVEKVDNSYVITVRSDKGDTATYKIQQISKDKIVVELPGGDTFVFDKVDCPLNGTRVNPESLPKQLKKRWYTTNGDNNLEFDFTGNNLIFKGSKYVIEDVVLFREKWGKQYRIIAKNSEGKVMMFYFKRWTGKYCQVGYYGKNGNLYKNNLAYPNYRTNSYGMNKSNVLITRGNEQSLIYYRYEDTDSLNTPVIEVKNDTLYLITNGDLQISLSVDSLVSIDAINCHVILYSIKQQSLSVFSEKGSISISAVEVQNFTANILDDSFLDISNNFVTDTMRLNINNSIINKRIRSNNKISLIMGTIENHSNVTLPKSKRVQLDTDSSSEVKMW